MGTAFHARPLWRAIGWTMVAAVVGLSLAPAPPETGIAFSDKFTHLAAYGMLMNWFAQLHADRGQRVALALFFFAMGVGLEFLQGLTGYRTPDPEDAAANAAGVAFGWLAAPPRLGNWLTVLDKALAGLRAR